MYCICYSGTGAGVDVVVSSVEAYLVALNKMLGCKDSFLGVEWIQISEWNSFGFVSLVGMM